MARIIDADILKENCRITGEFMNNFECVSLKTLGEIIDEQPTIEAEPVKQEWISVKDRLPNRGERVLCFMKSSGKNQNDTISDNVYNGILVGSNPPKYVWEWNGDYVTHWMPLPDPPKEL